MAKSEAVNVTQVIKNTSVTFVNADGTTPKELVAAGANDSVVKAVTIVTDDNAAEDILLFLKVGASNFPIGHVDVPALSGTNGAANAVNGLNATNLPHLPVDSQGNRVIQLGTGVSLMVGPLAAVTSGKTTTICAIVEDF